MKFLCALVCIYFFHKVLSRCSLITYFPYISYSIYNIYFIILYFLSLNFSFYLHLIYLFSWLTNRMICRCVELYEFLLFASERHLKPKRMYLQFSDERKRVGVTVFMSVFYREIPFSPYISSCNFIMRFSCKRWAVDDLSYLFNI